MRRLLGLTLIASLGATALATSTVAPADAVDTHFVVVRALDQRFDPVGIGCDGSPAADPDLELGQSEVHRGGQGSLRVRTAANSLGGLLLRGPDLTELTYPVAVVDGDDTDPHAQWRVEINDDVLTSDPLTLYSFFQRFRLDEATLHDGDGWSGTIDEYLADHGTGDTWSAGVLTGGCLGSADARVDGAGTPQATYDFEASRWVTLTVQSPHDGRPQYGDPYTLTALVREYVSAAQPAHPVADAPVTFLRHWWKQDWQPIEQVTTDQSGVATYRGRATRDAHWMARWEQPVGASPIDSPDLLQTAMPHLSRPRVNGHPCRIRSHDPKVCETMHLHRGRVVLSGSGFPARSVTLDAWVLAGPPGERHLIARRQDLLGRDGRWRLVFDTLGHHRIRVDLGAIGVDNARNGYSNSWEIRIRAR